MKHIISFACVAMLALMAMCASAKAQEQGGGMIAAVEQLSERLKLSPEQEQKVRAIVSETQEALKKDREAANGDRWALMGILRERIQTMDAKIEAELSNEQKAIYAEVKKERLEKMMQRMRERRGG